ncbi:hypothetical protein ACHQM5_003728 [Ranunculus cassubicifolius]
MVSKKAAFLLLLICFMFFIMSKGENMVQESSSDCEFKGECNTRQDCQLICKSIASICVPYHGKKTCCCII